MSANDLGPHWTAAIPPATKAAPTTPTPAMTAAAVADITTFAELCEKFPTQPATLQLFGQLTAFVVAMNEKNKERNATIQSLETRLLEIEATIAARQPVP